MMTIQKLSPQLANQIAAGEVVERPASVLKELLENSLDSGATKIEIDIMHGGAKLIRVRDNGSGIPKEQLAVALERHATSKISRFDDLTTLGSFGFRGEALASISSVSRLTLTSCVEQHDAWQVQVEGAQMNAYLEPAAHPCGTTVEVKDLFFNTPARRRFLKSEKTEFTHIEAWIKRCVIAHPRIEIQLTHHGKLVQRYKPVFDSEKFRIKLAQVCGKRFSEDAVELHCEHDSIALKGYVQTGVSPAHAFQYVFLNGRVIRDRVLSHAIKQAFAQAFIEESVSYVLMLVMDAKEFDINVHPAKYEVRFHQTRWVHDFLVEAITSGLASNIKYEASAYTYKKPTVDDFSPRIPIKQYQVHEPKSPTKYSSRNYAQTNGNHQPLLNALNHEAVTDVSYISDTSQAPILEQRFFVVVWEESLRLLPIKQVAKHAYQRKFIEQFAQGMISQPLLIPISVILSEQEKKALTQHESLLTKIGFEWQITSKKCVIKKAAALFKNNDIASMWQESLRWLLDKEPSTQEQSAWFSRYCSVGNENFEPLWNYFQTSCSEIKDEMMTKSIAIPWRDFI